MTKKSNQKIVKYHKPFQINIGIIVFAFIFIYLMYYIYAYFTDEQVSAYEVKQGSITQDTIYEGLVLREESVYYAPTSGYINYYCQSGTKTGVMSFVYSIDETGEFYQQVNQLANGTLELTKDGYHQLATVVDQYKNSYSDINFDAIYDFKENLEISLVDVMNSNAFQQIQNIAGNTFDNSLYPNLHTYTAERDGVLVYYVDGYEDVTLDDFNGSMLDSDSYKRNNFLKQEQVVAGDPVYKLATSEYWTVVIQIDHTIASSLAEETYVEVRFPKDETTAWASTKIFTEDGNFYLALEFKNSMIRFVSERYIEVELLLDNKTGLKIPNSSITTKDFLTVPKEYITKGGDSNKNGLFVEHLDEHGNKIIEFIATTLFYETDDLYYIDAESIKSGDIALLPDSNQRYILKDTEPLEGVYNVNKGYAIFKRIEKIYSNEEYTIIKNGTSYGVSMFDHIALNADTISENDITH